MKFRGRLRHLSPPSNFQLTLSCCLQFSSKWLIPLNVYFLFNKVLKVGAVAIVKWMVLPTRFTTSRVRFHMKKKLYQEDWVSSCQKVLNGTALHRVQTTEFLLSQLSQVSNLTLTKVLTWIIECSAASNSERHFKYLERPYQESVF